MSEVVPIRQVDCCEAHPADLPVLDMLDAASSPADWAAVRQLIATYADSLGGPGASPCFAREIEDLTACYGGPDAAFVIMRCRGRPIACAALAPIDAGVGELKRLYVLPCCRRLGLARQMLARLLDTARRLGYQRLVLETLNEMQAARALYAAHGFTPIAAYRAGANPHDVFLGLDLG